MHDFFLFQFNDFLNSLVVVAILVLEVKQGQESPQEDWLKYLLLTILSPESVEEQLVHKIILSLNLATLQDLLLTQQAHQRHIHGQQLEPQPLSRLHQGVKLLPSAQSLQLPEQVNHTLTPVVMLLQPI